MKKEDHALIKRHTGMWFKIVWWLAILQLLVMILNALLVPYGNDPWWMVPIYLVAAYGFFTIAKEGFYLYKAFISLYAFYEAVDENQTKPSP